MLADRLIVEILRDGGPVAPGELGEVVVTDLYSYAMPLIRYRMGDLARAGSGPCRCGLGLPVLDAVEGRCGDAMAGKDGDTVLPREWLELAPEADAPPGFAVRQAPDRGIEVLLLPGADAAALRDRLAAFSEDRVGVTPTFRSVAALPLTPMGKTRYVRSDRPPALSGGGKEEE